MTPSDSPDRFRPRVFLAFGAVLDAVCRVWFRFRVRGMDRIPAEPCILVGNHSGIGIADVLCLLGAFRRHFGLQRRMVGLMHDIFMALPIIGWLMQASGAVRANPTAARAAMARGYDVVVFPGGDIDSCRPVTAAREVRFGARRGYVRLALESGRPILPLVTHGSHFTYVVLPGGETLARLVGARRWSRNATWPITLGAVGLIAATVMVFAAGFSPWCIVAALIAMLVPTPLRVTSEVLAPIDVTAATAHIVDADARVEAAHELVHGALERALRTMTHDAPASAQGLHAARE